MAINRETIQLDITGLERINRLEQKLNNLRNVAAGVASSIGEISDQISDIEQQAVPIVGGIRRARSARAKVRQAERDPEFTTGLTKAESGIRQQLKKTGNAINERLRAYRTDLRDTLSERADLKRNAQELKRVQKGIVDQSRLILLERQREAEALADNRKSILQEARDRKLSSKVAGTQSLAQRRAAAVTRLGTGQGLTPEERRLQASFRIRARQALADVERADKEAEFLKKTAEASGVSKKQLTADLRLVEAARSQAATELGRSQSQIEELGRRARGRRSVARVGGSLESRIQGLAASGINPDRLSAEVSGKRVPLGQIVQQASASANLRNNIQGAKDLLSIASNRVTILEREVRLANKRESALDKELNRSLKLENLQRRLNDLRSAGATGAGFGRAEALVGRLPALEQAGSVREFDRVAKIAEQGLSAIKSSLTAQAKSTRNISSYQKSITKIEEKLESGKKISLEESRRLLAFNERVRGLGPAAQLALPPAAPGAPAFGGGARPARTESLIGGAAGPLIRERLGGARTAAEAAVSRRLAEGDPSGARAITKAEQKLAADRLAINKRVVDGIAKTGQQLRSLFDRGVIDTSAYDDLRSSLIDLGKATRNEVISNQRLLDGLAFQQRRIAGLGATGNTATTSTRLIVGGQRKTGTLTSMLGDLRESEVSAKVFRGGRSTDQAISRIVETFNKSLQPITRVSQRPLPPMARGPEAGRLAEIDRYRDLFAGLTSNPRFYGTLLNRLPREAITTTMAGAASERAASIGRPGLGVFRLGRGAGDLEGQILSAYKDSFGAVPSGIQQILDKIGSIADAMLGRLGGASGVGGGGGRRLPANTNGPDDLFSRASRATGNAESILGLKELADVSKASTDELNILSEALTNTRNGMRRADKNFDQIGDTIARVNRQIERQDPNADILTRNFGSRGGQAVGEGLIGGAFPLLFGQGAFASILGGAGGAAGGFAGGMLGFGLSLLGTALGSAIDGVMQAAQDTGNMLRDLTGNFDQIKESGLLASRSQEKLMQGLIDGGDAVAAYSIIQEELNRKLGVDGVSKLRAAADAGDRMQRAVSELGAQLQIFVAGPLADFLNKVAGVLEARSLENRTQDLLRSLPSGARSSFKAELTREAAAANPFKGPVASLFGFSPERAAGATGGGERSLISPEVLGRLISKYASQVPAPAKTTEERENALTRETQRNAAFAKSNLELYSKGFEGTDILRGLQQQQVAAAREQEDLDRQSFELRKEYERQIGDIREQILDRAGQIARDNAQRELEILAKQGEIRQAQLRNSILEIQGNLAGDDFAVALTDAVGAYLTSQLSAQDQIEQRRRQFEVEITNQQLEADKFKANIAKAVNRLNLDTADRVQQINFAIARRNEDAARTNFEVEKRIADLRLKAIRAEAQEKLNDKKIELAGLRRAAIEQPENQLIRSRIVTTEAGIQEAEAADRRFASQIAAISQISAPPRLRGVAPVATTGVSTAALDSANQNATELQQKIQSLSETIIALNRTGDTQAFFNTIEEAAFGASRSLRSSLESAREELAVTSGDTDFLSRKIAQSYEKLIADLEAQSKKDPSIVITDSLRNYLAGLQVAQIELKKLEPTLEFYRDAFTEANRATIEAKDAINELLGPVEMYDRVLQRINKSGGIEVDPETRKALLESARNVDALRKELKALNAIKDLAGGWTDAFIGFNKELLKGGNLMESLKSFAESVADRTLDVVLEFTLRPMQEKLFKDAANFLGFKPEQNPLLQPVESIDKNLTKFLDGLRSSVKSTMPQPAANGIVPGPSQASPQVRSSTPALSALLGAGLILPPWFEKAVKVVANKTEFFQQSLKPIGTPAEVLTAAELIKQNETAEIQKRNFQPEIKDALISDFSAAVDRVANQRLAELDQSLTKVSGSAIGAAQSIGGLADKARGAAEQVPAVAKENRTAVESQVDAVSKFQAAVGASLQLISGVAMGIGGAQMIKKGGAYNTLIGAASIFGGISSLASSAGSFGKLLKIPGFATGGRPDPYEPVMVGEEGPELWAPDRPGVIIPNDELYVPGLDDHGSASVPGGRYSRSTASGSSSDSSADTQGQSMSYGMAAPYQRSETTREIDRLEQVVSNPRELPPIKYETQMVNQYEFVTPDQLEESNKRTSKTTRQQTLREIADSMKVQRMLGIR